MRRGGGGAACGSRSDSGSQGDEEESLELAGEVKVLQKNGAEYQEELEELMTREPGLRSRGPR